MSLPTATATPTTKKARNPWADNRFLERDASGHLTDKAKDKAKRAFLRELAESGGNFRQSVHASGVNMTTLYAWRKADEEFAEAWHAIVHGPGADLLEAEAQRRAVDGVDEPVIYKGEQCMGADGKPLTVKKYSDTLLIVMLKMRGRFVDKTSQELTGPGGGPVQFERIERVILPPQQSRVLEGEVVSRTE